jgi:hypothetical protein
VLESRALRTLTQGHLSQHMFFHSLRQNAIPDAAPAIFGTSTSQFRWRDADRSALRLSGLWGRRDGGASRRSARKLAL